MDSVLKFWSKTTGIWGIFLVFHGFWGYFLCILGVFFWFFFGVFFVHFGGTLEGIFLSFTQNISESYSPLIRPMSGSKKIGALRSGPSAKIH